MQQPNLEIQYLILALNPKLGYQDSELGTRNSELRSLGRLT